ncbi:MAG: serine--tRNA ligase, partial [Planctomycetes bacterium]|nr:serine--tRNA ligase [Planctomycetota bacterium]
MLDRKFVLENLDAVKQNCLNRGVPADGLDRFAVAELARRSKLLEAEDFNRQANDLNSKMKSATQA